MQQETLQELKRMIIASLDTQSDFPVAVLPNDMKLQSVEPYMAKRFRFRGKLSTGSFDDFVEYCHNQTKGQCFIDADRMKATAIFDLGNLDVPGHAAHRATLAMRQTAPFMELLRINGNALSQKRFAEWLEEWAPHLTILDGTGEDAHEISLIKAISAVRDVTIAARQEANSTEGDFKASRSRFAEVEARTREATPALIRFRCEPYHGLEDRDFSLRISIVTDDDKPAFKLRALQMEAQEEAMAQEFQDKLRGDLEGSEITTYIGTFDAD